MTRIVLVRHGEADVTGRVLVGRAAGVHLNERGQEQARRMARRLEGVPLAAIYSSPLERTRETATELARRQSLEVSEATQLQELDFGAWQGCAVADLEGDSEWHAYNALRSLHRTPGGESIAEVQLRMAHMLEFVADEHPGETVALVSHGDPIRALVAHVLGLPLDLFGRLVVEPASTSLIVFDDGGPRLACLNDTDGEAYRQG